MPLTLSADEMAICDKLYSGEIEAYQGRIRAIRTYRSFAENRLQRDPFSCLEPVLLFEEYKAWIQRSTVFLKQLTSLEEQEAFLVHVLRLNKVDEGSETKFWGAKLLESQEKPKATTK